MHLPNPEIRRVITFPDAVPQAVATPQAVAAPHRATLYPSIILSLSSGIVIGLAMAASALWLDPEQHNIRTLQSQLSNAEATIDQVRQCMGDL